MYVGFHLDPLYRVHWNNEAPPMQFEITAPDGVSITPSKVVGPDPEADADADPREFLLEVDAADAGGTVDLQVKYFACDDALTFCVPVTGIPAMAPAFKPVRTAASYPAATETVLWALVWAAAHRLTNQLRIEQKRPGHFQAFFLPRDSRHCNTIHGRQVHVCIRNYE